MNGLYNTIISEINRCIGEIRKTDNEMIKLQERRDCYSDRKIMLEELRDKYKEENENA